LIPKIDKLRNFDEFRPISICNCVYKIITKVIAFRFKGVLSYVIFAEQFGFLVERKIHEAIGATQEQSC